MKVNSKKVKTVATNLFQSGIRPAIDDHLLKLAAEKRDYGKYWSASSAGYCMRKNIFERLGVPHVESDDDARKQRLFTAGHIFHDWIQGITKQAGLSIASEVELQDEDLMVRGHFDDLILVGEIEVQDLSGFPAGQKVHVVAPKEAIKQRLILYDYKTVNSRSFLWAKKNGNKMSYYHKLQLGTYMYMLRKGLGVFNEFDVKQANHGELPQKAGTITEYMGVTINDLTEARILKIEKENLMMMEQQLLWDTQLESEVLNYWNTLNTHWNNKTLPPCTCADHEGGFMAKEKFNPFYYEEEPCSLELYKKWKKA